MVAGGRGVQRWQRDRQLVGQGMNPFGRGLEFFAQVALAFKHQLHHDIDGGDEQAAKQAVARAAQQAKKKTPAIRPDKRPYFTQKINHAMVIL